MSDPVTTTTEPAAANNPVTPWYEGKSAEFIGTLENRGIKDKSAAEVAEHFWTAHNEARQAISKYGAADPARIAVIPKTWDNETEINEFYGKLRPAKAEEYAFEGDDAQSYNELAYEMGLTKHQGAKWQKWLKEGHEAEVKEAKAKADEFAEAMRKEDAQHRLNWAGRYDDNLRLAKIGLKAQYGMTDEQIENVMKSPNFSKALEGGLKYAQATGEDTFTSGDTQSSGPKSYEQAKAILDEFKRNPNGPESKAYFDKANPRHAEVQREMKRIFQIVADYENRQKEEWRMAS